MYNSYWYLFFNFKYIKSAIAHKKKWNNKMLLSDGNTNLEIVEKVWEIREQLKKLKTLARTNKI